MARLVMKFGGTSVGDVERIRNVARHVKREVEAGNEVAVVVSAMAGATNQLVAWCREASVLHDAREYDAVVASGEQVTSGLLAIVLQGMGIAARSWQGWQLPVYTSGSHASARIISINGGELLKRLRQGNEVAVISGFQGINKETGRIRTGLAAPVASFASPEGSSTSSKSSQEQMSICVCRATGPRGNFSLEFGVKFDDRVGPGPILAVMRVPRPNLEIHFPQVEGCHVGANSPFLVKCVTEQRDLWTDVELFVS
jgi:hypothetical protein